MCFFMDEPRCELACSTVLSTTFTPVACSQVSVWNLVRYNVIGGGQSALYGTEGPLYYARNLFNAFNLALLLAPVAPLVRRRLIHGSSVPVT